MLALTIKIKNVHGIVKATSDGKPYIENSDFFSLEKVKETIYKLKNSQLIKDIDNKKQPVDKNK